MKAIQNLIGKQVTAIGDCGMKKNLPVLGVLKSSDNGLTIITTGRYDCSVNPNTVKEVSVN